MAKLQQKRREINHEKEQREISQSWAKLASDITLNTDKLLSYTAWKNDNYIKNGELGLVDTEDMIYLNQEATLLFQIIQQNMAKLNDIFSVPARAFADPQNPDKTLLGEDNAALIAKYSLDINEWDSRYN